MSEQQLYQCPYCESFFQVEDVKAHQCGLRPTALDTALNELERITILWRDAAEAVKAQREEIERLATELADQRKAIRDFQGNAAAAILEVVALRRELREANVSYDQCSQFIEQQNVQIDQLRAALEHIANWPKNQLDGIDAARVATTILQEPLPDLRRLVKSEIADAGGEKIGEAMNRAIDEVTK